MPWTDGKLRADVLFVARRSVVRARDLIFALACCCQAHFVLERGGIHARQVRNVL
jgi:hypothetical protein